MLFHGLQTQTGVLRDLLVTSPFTGQLRNFPLTPREANQAWQTEKPESSGSFAVPAKVFTSDEEMWASHANGIDLLELNCGLQVR